MAYFGEIDGVNEGAVFKDLPHAAKARLIANSQKGISSGLDTEGNYGADAIVLNGGYDTDEDDGVRIVYTGDGAKNPGTEPTSRERALLSSYDHKLPIRVIRGSKLKSVYAPKEGCRYDGLYQINDSFQVKSGTGSMVYLFVLDKITSLTSTASGSGVPRKIKVLHERVVRDTRMARKIKRLYGNQCQICGLRLKIGTDIYYSEGAHIQPLGSPYNGPDIEQNILCLCPNHHVQFDNHEVSIEPGTLSISGTIGSLRLAPGHRLGREYLEYHYKRYVDRLKNGHETN